MITKIRNNYIKIPKLEVFMVFLEVFSSFLLDNVKLCNIIRVIRGDFMNTMIAIKILHGELIVLKVNDIIFFEKQGKKIKIYLQGNPGYVYMYSSMKELYNNLSIKNLLNIFLKPHCSYLININHIKFINTKNIVMSNKSIIPISNQNCECFLKKFRNNLIEVNL
jgi:DNA-binding LytR/AlgR family response regulator